MPKWWLSHQEFIHENSKRPPIDGCPMACMFALSEAVFLRGEGLWPVLLKRNGDYLNS